MRLLFFLILVVGLLNSDANGKRYKSKIRNKFDSSEDSNSSKRSKESSGECHDEIALYRKEILKEKELHLHLHKTAVRLNIYLDPQIQEICKATEHVGRFGKSDYGKYGKESSSQDSSDSASKEYQKSCREILNELQKELEDLKKWTEQKQECIKELQLVANSRKIKANYPMKPTADEYQPTTTSNRRIWPTENPWTRSPWNSWTIQNPSNWYTSGYPEKNWPAWTSKIPRSPWNSWTTEHWRQRPPVYPGGSWTTEYPGGLGPKYPGGSWTTEYSGGSWTRRPYLPAYTRGPWSSWKPAESFTTLGQNEYPRDCSEIFSRNPNAESGVYSLAPVSQSEPIEVYCDMKTKPGGWTVIQRRLDGFSDFYRSWEEYEQGFGDNPTGEYWIGNAQLAALTGQQPYVLRIEMVDHNGKSRYAEYSRFSVGGASTNYTLTSVGKFSGTAGDSLTYHVGQKFSTFDSDNDAVPDKNCAEQLHGAWWYKYCHESNLNGRYGEGINWKTLTGFDKSLQSVVMMIRPTSAVNIIL